MKDGPDISRVATLIGDPARANILTALIGGNALTVSELAEVAGVTIQTASSHLAKLHDGGLLRPRKQGRHKYFALADQQVAQVLEGLMGLAAAAGHTRVRSGPRDGALRQARLCYNHLAGQMGTRLFDSLVSNKGIAGEDETLALTKAGETFVSKLGIDLAALRRQRAPLCLECLDWSERRSHLAGALGRAFLVRFETLGWAQVNRTTRVVTFSVAGVTHFETLLSRAD